MRRREARRRQQRVTLPQGQLQRVGRSADDVAPRHRPTLLQKALVSLGGAASMARSIWLSRRRLRHSRSTVPNSPGAETDMQTSQPIPDADRYSLAGIAAPQRGRHHRDMDQTVHLGVIPPLAAEPWAGADLRRLLDCARAVEDLGFDSLWANH